MSFYIQVLREIDPYTKLPSVEPYFRESFPCLIQSSLAIIICMYCMILITICTDLSILGVLSFKAITLRMLQRNVCIKANATESVPKFFFFKIVSIATLLALAIVVSSPVFITCDSSNLQSVPSSTSFGSLSSLLSQAAAVLFFFYTYCHPQQSHRRNLPLAEDYVVARERVLLSDGAGGGDDMRARIVDHSHFKCWIKLLCTYAHYRDPSVELDPFFNSLRILELADARFSPEQVNAICKLVALAYPHGRLSR